ncbi:hypothetical protein AC579_8251 [Pseudocercospora musae]|uniref:Uncharacterized protein n=1 Tax=Pseudocercospora musae TaxID=113226 RepID=A0A139IVM1_9PEZI|nr:hypothetical protein AC579_8251 [Pseudocercospora musae]
MIRLLNIYTQQLREFQSPNETVPPLSVALDRYSLHRQNQQCGALGGDPVVLAVLFLYRAFARCQHEQACPESTWDTPCTACVPRLQLEASGKQDRLPKNLPYDPSLIHYLTRITDMPENELWDFSASQDLSYQKKRACLEKRETSRREDHAYCMLGILHASVLPMYGEGRQRAWKRVEEEVRKYQLLRGQDRMESHLPCYRPSRDLHSKSVEVLCRPHHVQQWSNSIGESGNETAATATHKARNDLAGREDLTCQIDVECTRLASRARKAHD